MFHYQIREYHRLLENKLTIHRMMNHLVFEDLYVVRFENVRSKKFELRNKKILHHLLNVTTNPKKEMNKNILFLFILLVQVNDNPFVHVVQH